MTSNYEFHKVEGGKPVKSWTKGLVIEPQAMTQLQNLARMPFIHHHVAAMPDVHLGIGATIGSVVPTKGAIIPAAVGVDIGCGMMAVKTSLMAKDLPDNLHDLRLLIEKNVPVGRTNDGKTDLDKGGWKDVPEMVIREWKVLLDDYLAITKKHPKAESHNALPHLGTLGTGNHFIELCLDKDQHVWMMLHSGSRGAGNRIGTYFIEKAKEEMARYHILPFLPDKDLSYLVEKTEIFDDYLMAVKWAQRYAFMNRQLMASLVLGTVKNYLGRDFDISDTVVNCHHNYVEMENHFNENIYVTRKGAVRARVGDLGIIPGSMGTGSFIVSGLGNNDSFHSCSHGAGRTMSRGQAFKTITKEQHEKAMKGIEARVDEGVLDESPAAYKDIATVMEAQKDLVEIKYELHQILNVKG